MSTEINLETAEVINSNTMEENVRATDNVTNSFTEPIHVRMAQIETIPSDIIKIIPIFNGDSHLLNMFIKKCEYIILNFGYMNSFYQTEYLMHVITSRLSGKAATMVSDNEHLINDWEQLKMLLYQHFGDQRSEECLLMELESISLKPGETFLELCNRIQLHRSNLFAKLNSTIGIYAKDSKKEIYNHIALNVFLYNLPKGLMRIVRLKNPQTLEDALQIVMEEVNFNNQYKMRNNLLHNDKTNSNRKIPPKQPFNLPQQRFNHNQQMNKSYNFQRSTNYRPNFIRQNDMNFNRPMQGQNSYNFIRPRQGQNNMNISRPMPENNNSFYRPIQNQENYKNPYMFYPKQKPQINYHEESPKPSTNQSLYDNPTPSTSQSYDVVDNNTKPKNFHVKASKSTRKP